VLANLLPAASALLSLNLTNNQLCGIDEYGDGAYTAEGIVQISEALKVNKTLQSINIDGHPLLIMQLKGDEPAKSIDLSNALFIFMTAEQCYKENDSKRLEVGSAVIIASLIGSNSVTKSLNLAGNAIGYRGDMASVNALCEMLKVNTTLQSINLSHNRICKDGNMEGLNALCEMLKVNKTLQSINLRDNGLDDKAKHQLRQAAPRVTFIF